MGAARDVKEYWEGRAEAFGASPQATTHDVFLRELEIRVVVDRLRGLALGPEARVLDLGCGDGYATLAVAERVAGPAFLGVDYSANMIANARRRLAARGDLGGRVAFAVGDALALDEACGGAAFDVVLTDRCLINLDTEEAQYRAVAGIAAHVKPGGHYLAIENFAGGQAGLEALRRALSLPPIPVRWHNLYFDEARFVAEAERYFEDVALESFASSYYLATRGVYAAMCRADGVEPDYAHPIHRLAVDLPRAGDFSPIKLALMRRRRDR